MGQKFEKFCQSCSMPLEDGKNSGTEQDGSKSYKYCSYCYKDGQFTDPDLTMDQMKVILDETIGKEGLRGRFLAFLGKMTLPKLERWKKN